MTGVYADQNIETGFRYGEPITIAHPALDEPATGTFVAVSGGPTALVRLDGTGVLVNVPRELIKRGVR